MYVDDILKASGDFGPAQWILLALFSVVNVVTAFHYFAQTFIFLSSAKCKNSTDTSVNIKFNVTTLSAELGWDCEGEWTAALVQSMFFIGSCLGTLTIGFISDRLGRRPVVVISNMLAIFGNLLTAYLIPGIVTLSIARFIAGLAVDTNFFMMYILVMEYISPGMRTIGLNLCIGVWYCIGSMATPWVAVLCKDWRIFLTVISLATCIVPIFAFFIPESAQWYISRGQNKKALNCFQKVAAINRKNIPDDLIPKLKISDEEVPKNAGSIRGLFATPKLRRKTLILIFKTMVLTLCYDALSRNIQGLGYDPFTMFTVTSATIFPACVVIFILQDRVGRKAIAVLALMLTGLLCFIQSTFLSMGEEYTYIGAIIGICSRFSVNIAYNSGTQYAAELIPTEVRGQGLSAMHVVGYIAAFFSPQILVMSKAWVATPTVVIGILSILGAGSCMFLPETLDRTLPVTLEEGEAFGDDERFWDFISCNRNKKEKMESGCFGGITVTPSLQLLAKVMPDVSDAALGVLLKVVFDVIEKKPLPPRTLEKLTIKSSSENVEQLFGGLLVLVQTILRQKSDAIKESELRQCLKSLKFTEDCCSLFLNAFIERKGTLYGRQIYSPYYLKLKKLDWRIDITVSSSAFKKAFDTVIILQMMFVNGETRSFEISISKFHLLRLYVASMLKEIQTIEKKNAIRNT